MSFGWCNDGYVYICLRSRTLIGISLHVLTFDFVTGLYHIGHVLGLLEAGVLPDIISGTSGGSVIGAILCTRTDEEIRRDLNPSMLITKLKCFSRPWSERIKSLWQNGNLYDFDDWMEKIQW
jgi:predicted acylesterase/phospholipase RssA